MSQEISETDGRIFTKFGRELCKGLINPAFIWRSLDGRCHGNQFKMQNRRFWWTNLHCRAGIPKPTATSELQLVDEKRVECGCIVYKFGEVWFSNSGVPFAHFYRATLC